MTISSSNIDSSQNPQGYLKWLNSMRAFGVLLVLIYHFFPSFMPGGFIGVDIFFVVSGYLITSILLREFASKGKIHLSKFYVRRWRRLFPAICAMLLISLPLSLLISPDLRMDIARQSAAVLSWTTNYYEILTGQSYEAQLLPHLFIHTWTLSVEMQYYLIWGAIVTFYLFLIKNMNKGRIAVLFTATMLFIGSSILMASLAAKAEDPSVAYMSTFSHFFPLMIGSAFAAIGGFFPLAVLKKLANLRYFHRVSQLFTLLGVAFIIWLSFDLSFTDPRVYSWGILVISLISGVIILFATLQQEKFTNKEWAITNYIGLRSYSIYLFHWPLMIVLQHLLPTIGVPQNIAGTVGSACAIPLTFIFAELSFRFVEQKFRVQSKKPVSEVSLSENREASSNQNISSVQNTSSNQNDKTSTHKRIKLAVSILVVMVLCTFSAIAIKSAPFMSNIEADLKYGTMTLDIINLERDVADE